MKKVFLGLLLVVVSFSAKAQTTEKMDDMDRIELCKKNYTALFGGEALNGEGTDPEIMDILQKLFSAKCSTREIWTSKPVK